jgi:OOP family OmpA-OmpF porin
MFRNPALVMLIVFSLSAHAQGDDARLACGTITDAATQRAIKASIRYASVPSGSITGQFIDSTYAFTFFGLAKYKITAEAEGYRPRTILLDPSDIGTDERVERNIALMPEAETIRLSALIFEQGKAQIASTSYRGLDAMVDMMKDYPRMIIQLEGHTDNVGSHEANMRLAQARVDAVKEYLTSKGISKSRIKTKAFGGSQPLATEDSPEARILNRRVEMRILKAE